MPANPQQHQQQHHLSACSSWQQGRAWLFAPATHTGCSSSTPARHLPGSVTLPSVQQQQQHPPPQQQLLASIQQQPSLSAAAAAAGRLSNLHGRRLAFIPSVTEQQPAVSTTSSSVASSSHAHGQQPQQQRSLKEALHSAGVRALGGGLPGAAAMVVQVLSLMWLRTTVNYQYRYGTSTRVALRTLYADGGVARFYQGVGPALLQGPLCRFGDTAANAGVLSMLAEFEATRQLPLGVQTAAASAAAATWRLLLLPLDAAKTMMQVEGKHGLQHLWVKVRRGGPGVLYHGAAASVAASFVGHYPWFTTYNTLNSLIPLPDTLHGRLLRSAGIGFCAGVISDAVSNSVRVVKTSRQTARHSTSYSEVVKSIIAKDGVTGLFTRGLTTRIAANGLQNICFTVLWNLGQERLKGSKLMASLNGHHSSTK